ncbi:2277_t:CDS:2, partial [Diversispora eburnea]
LTPQSLQILCYVPVLISKKLFVFLKVLNVEPNSKFIYQKALLTDELRTIFDSSPKITLQPSQKSVKQLKEQITFIKQHKRKPIDGKCPICYDPLNNNEKLVWCQSGCGNNIHEDCFIQWERRTSPA